MPSESQNVVHEPKKLEALRLAEYVSLSVRLYA